MVRGRADRDAKEESPFIMKKREGKGLLVKGIMVLRGRMGMRTKAAFFSCMAALFLAVAGTQAFSAGTEEPASACRRTVWNRGWEFRLEDEPGKGDWQTAHLPHTFSLPYFMSESFYTGRGSYRKKLVMPEEWKGRKVFLDCGAAFQVAEVLVNGRKAGSHEGGYTAFRTDLTPFLEPGENQVEVRVDNRWSPRIAPRAGEHTFSGGLYRNVHLHVCSPVHLLAHGVWVQTPEVTPARGKVRILAEVKNDSPEMKKFSVRHTVREDKEGRVVLRGEKPVRLGAGGAERIEMDLPPLASPKLWSPSAPNMYRVVTELVDAEGIVLDRTENPLGFRSLELTADRGMLINGKPVYLQGANVHQDHAGWGDAVTDAGARRDVLLMKNAGFNFIRGSHYPHSRAFLDACDREGMCMLNEGIFWGMGGFKEHDKYWNCDAYPTDGKDRAAFEESCMRQVREMVIQFRNHPSIVVWSISNEPFFTRHAPESRALCNKLIALVKELDPSRPVCAGGGQRGGFDKLGDLAAFNGDGSHVKTPGRPSMVTEYGSVSCQRPGAYAPGWGDMARDKKAGVRYPWRVGEAVWCGFDHGSIWPSGGRMGIVDYFRIPKRAWYWYRNEFRNIPPPEWPVQGTPKQVKLSADKKVISPADGTDDVHLMVKVADASGKQLSNAVPVTLSVESGPGEFPTGKSITFTPGTDIDLIDGCAAIEFRSHYAGKTVIRAASPGLKGDRIQIVSRNAPAYAAGKSAETRERPYRRFTAQERDAQLARYDQSGKAAAEKANLAVLRPCSASSNIPEAMKASDGDGASVWMPSAEDKAPWWQLDMEFEFRLDRVEVKAAGMWKGQAPVVQISRDGKTWKDVKTVLLKDGTGLTAACPKDEKPRYVRIRLSPGQGMAEVAVWPADAA